MNEKDALRVLQISLIVAFVASVALYSMNTEAPPTNDPWFLTILFALLWLTFKS